jgi:FliI/YscN family ATPase
MPAVCIGTAAQILARDGRRVGARVAAVDGSGVTLVPFAGVEGIAAGDAVSAEPVDLAVSLGSSALGRAFDAFGRPLDGRGSLSGADSAGASRSRVIRSGRRGERAPLELPFGTGIRVLDGPLAFGIGARIGVFGAPGCGKSTLLEMLVAGSDADANIVALVGERGREAERWISRIDPRTTIVCATSDRSPAERLRAAEVAFAQAEALRERGLHVLLVLDSLARVAAAARDVAVAAGEPVGRGGYPPSIFGTLAGLLERAGNFGVGSITLVATVLFDGPDERDPVSEACRAALDGHIVLSDRLARQGWFPAVDLPASASRTLADVVGPAHLAAARRLRRAVAFLDETREARQFGLDPGVGDPLIRAALANERAIAEFLCQSVVADSAQTLRELTLLADRLGDGHSG